jgi:hypothetical protein
LTYAQKFACEKNSGIFALQPAGAYNSLINLSFLDVQMLGALSKCLISYRFKP